MLLRPDSQAGTHVDPFIYSLIHSFIHSSDDPFTKVSVYQGVDTVSSKRAEGSPAPTATLGPTPSQEPTLPRQLAPGFGGAWGVD